MKMKVCVFTGTRAEYGVLRWIISELKKDLDFDVQIIVSGTHLSPEYGLTYREIENDGFEIDYKVEMLLSSDSTLGVAKSMGICILGVSDALEKIHPDLLILLGDRYELLAVAATALIMRVPIVHISGGDITEGAIDNEVRNSISQMADFHFPGTEEAAKRLQQMGILKDNILVAGEPGLDNFNKLLLMSRDSIAGELGLNKNRAWIIVTYHPETKNHLEKNIEAIQFLISALLEETDAQIIATYSNADNGGRAINQYLNETANGNDRLIIYKSLGQMKYLSLLKESAIVAGNSSSGVIETPFLGVPTINIGSRQQGRHLCPNVYSIPSNHSEIVQAIRRIRDTGYKRVKPDFFYGDGHSAEKIAKALKAKYLHY